MLSLCRYCCLAQCLLFRDISMQVRKRFPTLDTVVVGSQLLLLLNPDPPHLKSFQNFQQIFLSTFRANFLSCRKFWPIRQKLRIELYFLQPLSNVFARLTYSSELKKVIFNFTFSVIQLWRVPGFMMQHEKERFESISNGYAKYWMPFQWAISLANEARSKGACESDIRVDSVVQVDMIVHSN